MNVPFHKPIIPTNISSVLKESADSGWLTTGPKVKEFEGKLCKYIDSEYVVAVNSCTAALHLALAARDIGQGDSFIAPTYTFVASVEVGEYLGAKPVLVDSDLVNYNLNLNQVEDILKRDTTNKIKAIIPVHFAGRAVDMAQLWGLAQKYNLFLLEDCAHSLETVSNIGKVGNTQNAAAFSFYANKNITTGGEGGALATNDQKLAERVRKLSLHGMSKDGWNRFALGGKWAYDVSELGYKYNMTDISAAFGIDQLVHMGDWHKRRLEIAGNYNEGLSPIEGMELPPLGLKPEQNAWHLYVIKIIPEMWNVNRNELIDLINNRGIGTSVHYIPVHMHSYYVRKYGYKPEDYPVAKELSETVITLPLYPKMTKSQVEYVIDVINDLWENYKN